MTRFLNKHTNRRNFLAAGGSLALSGAAMACSGSGSTEPDGATENARAAPALAVDDIKRPTGWTEATHGDSAEPNYAVVFPQDKVNQMKVTVTPESYQAMLDDMTGLFGARGTGGNRGGGFGGAPVAPGQNPGGGAQPGGGGGDLTPENPIWVPATVEFNGRSWTNVGFRFKGNSTLRGSWSSGSLKMPFKMDFDEFEEDHPETRNQRFYGFKQLSLANGQGDASFLREKTAYQLLEEAGLPAAKTAYYELTMDFGEGPKYLGVYVVIEVVDDTLIPRVFGDDSGNIYEADGGGANLAAGSQGRLQASFLKENNEDKADWSDIRALYDALHATSRTTSAAQWRAGLEKVFDVPVFLEWLALSAAMMHWDTYGGMTHNYYLYNNPKSSKLVWISWDHNNVLGSINAGGPAGQAPAGGAAPGGPAGMARMNVSLDKANVAATWPLIRYLMDDPTYNAAYVAHMRDIATSLFTAEKMAGRYQKLAALVGPSVAKESANTAFQSALQSLTATTNTRIQAVQEYLAGA